MQKPKFLARFTVEGPTADTSRTDYSARLRVERLAKLLESGITLLSLSDNCLTCTHRRTCIPFEAQAVLQQARLDITVDGINQPNEAQLVEMKRAGLEPAAPGPDVIMTQKGIDVCGSRLYYPEELPRVRESPHYTEAAHVVLDAAVHISRLKSDPEQESDTN